MFLIFLYNFETIYHLKIENESKRHILSKLFH
jgi:hypothetical protein